MTNYYVPNGVMSGHALHIRQLKPNDVAQFSIDLHGIPIEECVAIEGEDLGTCLAAVVHLNRQSDTPVVWSDADGKGTPIGNAFSFADSVAVILTTLFEHLSE